MEFIFPTIIPGELLAGYRARVASWNGYGTSKELGLAMAKAFPDHAREDKTLTFIHAAAWRNATTPGVLMQRHSCRHVVTGLKPEAQERFDSPRSQSASWSFSLYTLEQVVRSCPACVAEDLAMRPFAYWRRSHQAPGMYACHLHGCDLLLSACMDLPPAWPEDVDPLPAPFSSAEREALDRNKYVQTAIAVLRQLVDRELVLHTDKSAPALRQHLASARGGTASNAELAQLAKERFSDAWTRYVLPRAGSLDRILIKQGLLEGRATPYAVVAMLASFVFDDADQALAHMQARPMQETVDAPPHQQPIRNPQRPFATVALA